MHCVLIVGVNNRASLTLLQIIVIRNVNLESETRVCVLYILCQENVKRCITQQNCVMNESNGLHMGNE